MPSATNAAFLALSRRAEANARNLLETFIDIGPLFTLLSSNDHQILFGRRGTGKTHALSYLASDRELRGDVVALIDLRKVGSNWGMYGDPTQRLQERATGLIVDTLCAVHEALRDYCVSPANHVDLTDAGPALDSLADAITQVRVVGDVEHAATRDRSDENTRSTEFSASAGTDGINAAFGTSVQRGTTAAESQSIRRTGQERLYVNFGSVGTALEQVVDVLNGRRLWVLLDEWSSIPLVLQPYLADLLRRSVFPVTGATVKIAAIEQRSRFQLRPGAGDYIGIELGADASASLSLDDFMVFDNDSDRAADFFRNLIARHVGVAAQERGLRDAIPANGRELIQAAFSDAHAFEEFVRAAEGVPRDAINILTLAAQRALESPISVQHVRFAAKTWFQRDKDTSLGTRPDATKLLHWIVGEVIGRRRARAFVLASDTCDSLIDALYDARVLHIVKRGISTHEQPGITYDVLKLDYGCYVDLVSTTKAPLGLLQKCDSTGTEPTGYVDTPPDDHPSIQHAVLPLRDFYAAAGT